MASPVVVPPAPTVPILAEDGVTVLGAFPVSDQDKAQLQAGKTVVLSFRTPRMLRQMLGERYFTVSLRQVAGNIICDDGPGIARAIAHIAEISSAFAIMNSAIKNVKPDPNV